MKKREESRCLFLFQSFRNPKNPYQIGLTRQDIFAGSFVEHPGKRKKFYYLFVRQDAVDFLFKPGTKGKILLFIRFDLQ